MSTKTSYISYNKVIFWYVNFWIPWLSFLHSFLHSVYFGNSRILLFFFFLCHISCFLSFFLSFWHSISLSFFHPEILSFFLSFFLLGILYNCFLFLLYPAILSFFLSFFLLGILYHFFFFLCIQQFCLSFFFSFFLSFFFLSFFLSFFLLFIFNHCWFSKMKRIRGFRINNLLKSKILYVLISWTMFPFIGNAFQFHHFNFWLLARHREYSSSFSLRKKSLKRKKFYYFSLLTKFLRRFSTWLQKILQMA